MTRPDSLVSQVSAQAGRLACFKAYDIRGKVPTELDEGLARAIGRAYAKVFSPRRVALCKDMRLSSDAIAAALADGLQDSGVDVVDLGLGGTELSYFAAFHLAGEGVDGGIAVTASHNPAEYNGMKLVQRGAVPVSGDSGLRDVEALAAAEVGASARAGGAGSGGSAGRGRLERLDVWDAYVTHVLGYVDTAAIAPMRIVANAGNGCAGIAADRIFSRIPQLDVTRLHFTPDGRFPNGVPNPMHEASRVPTAQLVRERKAAVGLAWDGDHDRCFFFDDAGEFVEGYYMVGLFAQAMLERARDKGEAIVHDPRLLWNTVDIVQRSGGRAVLTKTGHAFIKERMRKENALYGGEMSAHHYFREFGFCDSGMIPWLLLLSTMSRAGKSLHELVGEMQQRFPCSGEINLTLNDGKAAIACFERELSAGAVSIDKTDGVSIEHATWRANVRTSNTEPVVRLNVETRGDPVLMAERRDAILALLRRGGA